MVAGPAQRSPATLGPLEARVLDALWRRGGDATVRDLQSGFAGMAYTTLMTTLDRLFRKGLLSREKVGRAFAYRTRWSRKELSVQMAGNVFAAILPSDSGTLRPIISMFVDEVGRRDATMLDELEEMIRRKREGEA